MWTPRCHFTPYVENVFEILNILEDVLAYITSGPYIKCLPHLTNSWNCHVVTRL